MAKKTTKLSFSKTKSNEQNFREFEKYILQLNRDFGIILLQNLDKSTEEIRDTTKDAINNLIEIKVSNGKTLH